MVGARVRFAGCVLREPPLQNVGEPGVEVPVVLTQPPVNVT